MTPWTVAHQAPLSMEVFRQESWSRQIFPSAGHLLDPRIKPGSCAQIFYHLRHQGSPSGQWIKVKWTWSSRRWQEWTLQLWNQWTKMEGHGKINSGDHYIYYCEQEFLRRNGVALIVNKIVQNAVLGYNLKNSRMISVRFQGKLFNMIVIQVYATTTNAKEAEVEWSYKDLQDLLVQFSSVAQSCLTLCDPMNRSMPGLPVHHQLPELAQTHLHRTGDASQPSHPLLSPSPPAFSLSQHQGLFQWISSSHQVAKVLELQLQHQSFQWTLRTDLGQTGWISLQSKGFSRIFSNTTVQNHQFFGAKV